MALDTLVNIICGAAFGMALTAAGVHRPDVIVSQLTLTNFHMLESFLAAIASSTAIVALSQRLRIIDLSPRNSSSIGLLGRFDGNIIGGLLLGAGMALSGSCPGTVFAQVGAGMTSGLYAFSGTILGGILFTGFIKPLLPKSTKSSGRLTISQQLGISDLVASVAVISIVFIAISAAVLSSAAKTQGIVAPVFGGFLIGGAQLLTLILRKQLLGTSTAFEEAGNWFWSTLGRSAGAGTNSFKNIMFASGAVFGARALSTQFHSTTESSSIELNRFTVVFGGILLAVGSRIAGGCTSGHGISGISLLSISSFVTVGAMFSGGIITALALY